MIYKKLIFKNRLQLMAYSFHIVINCYLNLKAISINNLQIEPNDDVKLGFISTSSMTINVMIINQTANQNNLIPLTISSDDGSI